MAKGGARVKKDEPTAPTPFGIGMGEMLTVGWKGYRNNFLSVTAPGVVTFSFLALSFLLAQSVGGIWQQTLVLLGGLVVTSAVSLPWYRAALNAFDGVDTRLSSLLHHPGRFGTMMFASVFVWAGVQFGLRYLRGIPSVFVIILYGFYGFIITEHPEVGGMKALGQSVLLGQGRKMGIAVVAAVLILLNLASALPVGLILSALPGSETGPLAQGLAVVFLIFTTSWSMVCGAAVYRMLQGRTLHEGT